MFLELVEALIKSCFKLYAVLFVVPDDCLVVLE